MVRAVVQWYLEWARIILEIESFLPDSEKDNNVNFPK